MSRILDVYLHNHRVGALAQARHGVLTFTYSAGYLKTATHGISLSLPLQAAPHTGKAVKAFFAGLLPEHSVQTRLANYLGLSEKNPFALLEAVGGDCAGALALYPRGEQPEQTMQATEALSNAQLLDLLTLIKRRPMLAGEHGFRLSLAGAQDKLAVGFHDGRVLLIKGGAPTTHILKPVISGLIDSGHNELFCMQLAQMTGIDAPKTALHFVDDTPYYLVQRYDRQIDNAGKVTRIHQEDFCQATGIASETKYEREGGPSIAASQTIIAQHTARPAVDQIKLLNRIVFNFLIGNADAHGKNFSLYYRTHKPELAPAYDLLSTAIYPDLSTKLAMKIGGKYDPNLIRLRHFYKLVSDTKTAQTALTQQIETTIKKVQQAAPLLKAKLNTNGLTSDTFDQIISHINARAQQLSP